MHTHPARSAVRACAEKISSPMHRIYICLQSYFLHLLIVMSLIYIYIYYQRDARARGEEFELQCTFLQVYNERVYDLLVPDTPPTAAAADASKDTPRSSAAARLEVNLEIRRYTTTAMCVLTLLLCVSSYSYYYVWRLEAILEARK